MPNRVNPIAKSLFALSAMIVAWTAYVKMAVPFLEGPPTVVRRQPVDTYHPDVSEALDKSHLATIVPADSWELGSCKTLLTSQGTIYFKSWDPVDDQGTYQLEPFTIVINDPVNKMGKDTPESEPSKKTAPIVLRAMERARLKFSKPITARSDKEDVELESAQLDGQVTVFRPANPETEEDQLRILTRNIQVTRSQIFTLADVYFSFGPHHGSGRNLSIQLAHEYEADSPAKSFSNINGVEQMELAFVSELVLQPVDAHAFSPDGHNQSTTPVGQNLSLSNQKTPLRLSCDGPFIFRMGEKKAWFRDNVVVTQLDDFRDNLNCESLQIEFEQSDVSSDTSVNNLIAIGKPDKPATIVSNSQQTMIVGEELNFDVKNSIVKATGSTPTSIRSPKFAFQAPTFEYQLAQNGKLGPLVADGPGTLQGRSGEETFEVRWEQNLTTHDFDAERIQIDVDSEASVKFDQESRITADHLKFIVWQLPDPNSNQGETKWKYFPSRLDARGNVHIVGEKIDGSAKEMIANWEKPTAQESGIIKHTVSFRPTPSQQQDTYGFRPPPSPRQQRRGDFRSLPNPKPAIKFSGDKVIANVAGSMNKMTIRDLTVDGSLALESNADDRRSFKVAGRSMKLVPQANELYRVTIDGNGVKPATFKSDGFDLTGNNLQIDQSANTIWVQGSGVLNIAPSSSMNLTPVQTETAAIENAKVAWTGGMVFDGAKIYFENEVELSAYRPPNDDGHRSTLKTDSEALTIELTKPIRFEKVGADKMSVANGSQPEIKRMVFVNHVKQNNRAFKLASTENKPPVIGFQNATFDTQGGVLDMQKLFVPMATVDALTGEIVTQGPGQAMVYQYTNGQNRLSGFNSDNAIAGSGQQKLTCIHSRFDGQLTANSNKGTMRISRNTRSAWGNVDRLDQTLDPDRPDRLPLGAAVLKSDVLRFAQWTPRNGESRQEVQAEGNTSIKSELFETVADRLTYNDATDMLVIEGRPPALAKLSYRSSPNSMAKTVTAQKVQYRLSDQSTSMSDVRNVQAGLSGQ